MLNGGHLPRRGLRGLLPQANRGVLNQRLTNRIKVGVGAIVITTSDMGIKPFKSCAAYVAAKAGLISLTKTLALECADLGIRVNAISPGETDTAMGLRTITQDAAVIEECESWIPMKRSAEPMEIAHVALFLASKEASYVTGEVILADGGRMLHDASLAKLPE